MSRLIGAVLILLTATGCERAHRAELTIYDWEAQRGKAFQHGARDLSCRPQACPDISAKTVYVFGAPHLGGDDLDRGSTEFDVDAQTGQPVVLVRFTPSGRRRFEDLTRTLARRGARMKRAQHLLLVVDNVVYASPYIDYRRHPDGIGGDNGMQFGTTSRAEARDLAEALRQGS
jgi:preprotein translocase subunit SecD